MIVKRRGRPKGSKNKASRTIETAPSRLETLKKSMNDFIDKQATLDIINARRYSRGIEEQDTNSLDSWDEEQSMLVAMWHELQELRLEENKAKEEECVEAIGDLLEELCAEEEDEDRAVHEVLHTTRASYLKWKPARSNLTEEGLESLPYDKRQIILEHWDEIFADGITYQEQIAKVVLLIYDPTRGSNAGAESLGMLFGITRGAMQTHITRLFSGERNESIGRPAILNESHMLMINNHVRKRLSTSDSPDLHSLQNWIYRKFSISVSTNTILRIIQNSETMKICSGIPLEELRAKVPLETIRLHYDNLSSYLKCANIPPQFVFNVDESGFQSFVDAVSIPVVVPADYPNDTVPFSVVRNGKRASLIGCISADGSALRPTVVVPRKRIAANLKYYGYTEKTCEIINQESGFVNAAIFDYWATETFFPEVQKRRREFNYEGDVLLMLDGCTSHFSDYFLDECTYFNVFPWKEPPGTSDQIQPLDLGIFGPQKTLKRGIQPPEQLSTDEQEIISIIDSWQRATTPENVTSAFRQAGMFIEKLDDGRDVMRADIEFARAVRGMEHTSAPIPNERTKTIQLKTF